MGESHSKPARQAPGKSGSESDMAVPSSVKRQAEEAERIQKALAENPAGATSPAPQGEGQEGNPTAVAPEQQTDLATQAPGNPTPVAPTQQQHDWEARFKEYKRTTDQTIFELRQDVRERTGQIEDLQRQIEQAQQAATQVSSAPSLLTDEQRDELGDMADHMEQIARQLVNNEVQRAIQQHVAPMQQSVQRIESESQQTKEQRFWSVLTEAVPNWREVNADDRFHAWLGEVDPLTGSPRQQLLVNAQTSLDAERVSAIFNAWISQGVQPQSQRPSLDTKVTPPTRSGASDMPSDAGIGRLWSRAEITAFYDDKRRGVFAGREEEARRTEADIMAASKEGRIR